MSKWDVCIQLKCRRCGEVFGECPNELRDIEAKTEKEAARKASITQYLFNILDLTHNCEGKFYGVSDIIGYEVYPPQKWQT